MIKGSHHTKEAIDKNREAKKLNPTRYWEGKNLPKYMKDKISETLKGNIPWNKNTKGLMPEPWNKGLKSILKSHRKGITLEEEYGIERAKEIREASSNAHLGKPSGKKGYRFTEEQKEGMRGKNGYWWKGGISKDYEKQLATREWQQIAMKIRIRDNFICQECGKKPALDVHHLIPWQLTHNDNENNLITLCRSCHMKIEHKNGIIRKEINNECCIST